MTLGIARRYLNLMVDFMVVKVPSSYNMILGRILMRTKKVVLLTYHLVLKFPTEEEVGEVRGDQIMTHEYYLAPIRDNIAKV